MSRNVNAVIGVLPMEKTLVELFALAAFGKLGAPAMPDDLILVSHRSLADELATALVDHFSGPYGPGAIGQSEARYMVLDGIARAMLTGR